MKIKIIILCICFIASSISCTKIKFGSNTIILDICDERFEFDNSECDFDNRHSQSQFNFTSVDLSGMPEAFVLFSNYRSMFKKDTIDLSIHLYVEYEDGQTRFSINKLDSVLQLENSNVNPNNIYPRIHTNACGLSFSNHNVMRLQKDSPYMVNKNFNYFVKDYKINYESDCIEKALLYIELEMSGKMYYQSSQQILDSTIIAPTTMKLLFDIEE